MKSKEYGPEAKKRIRIFLWSAGLAVLVLLLIVRSAALPGASSCGTERWDVKTLGDPAAAEVLVDSPSPATVTQLRQVSAPRTWSNTLPRQEAERHVYVVHAWLLGYKAESDQDFHLVLSEVGDKSKTMIAEIPSTGCVKKRGDEFAQERMWLASIHKAPARGKMVWFSEPVPVKAVGVFFFDKPHGQTGLAPNAAELHPLLSISKDAPTATREIGEVGQCLTSEGWRKCK